MSGRIKSRKYKDSTRELTIIRDRGMCVVHQGLTAHDVHEIVPRGRASRQEKADPDSWLWELKNRCCLCRGCHSQAHTVPWRTKLIKLLRERFEYDYSMDPWRFYLVEEDGE